MVQKAITLTVDEKVLQDFDKERGLVPRSTMLAWLMERFANDRSMQPFPGGAERKKGDHMNGGGP